MTIWLSTKKHQMWASRFRSFLTGFVSKCLLKSLTTDTRWERLPQCLLVTLASVRQIWRTGSMTHTHPVTIDAQKVWVIPWKHTALAKYTPKTSFWIQMAFMQGEDAFYSICMPLMSSTLSPQRLLLWPSKAANLANSCRGNLKHSYKLKPIIYSNLNEERGSGDIWVLTTVQKYS